MLLLLSFMVFFYKIGEQEGRTGSARRMTPSTRIINK
jgi:hypothetical protein